MESLGRLILIGCALSLCFAITLGGASPTQKSAPPAQKKDEATPVPKLRKNNLAPLPASEKIVSAHAPFEESAFTKQETDTLTQFRDGTRNLHYVSTKPS